MVMRTASAVENPRFGSSRTRMTSENVGAVRQCFLQAPELSGRKCESAVGLSARTVRHTFHLNLKFHFYKIIIIIYLLRIG